MMIAGGKCAPPRVGDLTDSLELIEFILSSSSCGDRRQARHAQQVIGTGGQIGLQLRACDADHATLAHAADGLQPAEDLLDAFSFALTGAVAGMTRGACIDCGTTVGVVLCNMRRAAVFATAAMNAAVS